MSTQKPLGETGSSGSNGTPGVHTLVDLLTQRADQREDKLAFSFSRDGEEVDSVHVTYRQLDTQARRIAR